MDKNDLIINLKNIFFSYPGSRQVLDNLNFEFYRGDKLGLVGSNGSGKTTLFHIIMGLLSPSSGTIELFGKPVKKEQDFKHIRQRIGLLFQDADDQLFSPTVLEDVAFGPLNSGKSRNEAISIAERTLKRLGLAGFEDRITFKLSGGEKRLVSLATVLAMEPEVLLLDEPTNGLDDRTKAKFIEVLSELNLSFILISHEIDFLVEAANAIYSMEKGRIMADKKSYKHQHVHFHQYGSSPHEHG